MGQISSLLIAIGVAAAVWLTANPGKVAEAAVKQHLQRRVWPARLLKTLHAGLMHTRQFSQQFSGQFRYELTDFEQLLRFSCDGVHQNLNLVQEVENINRDIQNLVFAPINVNQDIQVLLNATKLTSYHDLGFQTENPLSDFRGSGKFGYKMLEYFCTQRPERHKIITECGSIDSAAKSAKGDPWYPLALVSIRVSMKLYELLRDEPLLVLRLHQTALYTDSDWFTVLQTLHSQLLGKFHEQWLIAYQEGRVKHYFDTEIVLKEFDNSLPMTTLLLMA